MAKRKQSKKRLSNAEIVKMLKKVIDAIKRSVKTAIVKMIIKCTALLTVLEKRGNPAPRNGCAPRFSALAA